MLNYKSSWTRIADQEEDHFFRIHAWQTDSEEEGKTIAIVDMLTGRVIYLDQAARKDPVIQNRIRSVVERAGKNHPYSIERLEPILCSVIDYECEEGPENRRWNLEAMGFDEEEKGQEYLVAAIYGFYRNISEMEAAYGADISELMQLVAECRFENVWDRTGYDYVSGPMPWKLAEQTIQ